MHYNVFCRTDLDDASIPHNGNAVPDPHPLVMFHLAVAYHRLDNLPDARRQLALAQAAGLADESLYPDEQRWLRELSQALQR